MPLIFAKRSVRRATEGLIDMRRHSLHPARLSCSGAAEAEDQRLHRICEEYLNVPGLRLWPREVQRLWGLDEATAVQLMDALVEARFLLRTVDGTYIRRPKR